MRRGPGALDSNGKLIHWVNRPARWDTALSVTGRLYSVQAGDYNLIRRLSD
jgi:hypothetical protein